MGDNRFKCDKCGKYQPIGTKTITCIDCGEEKQIPSTSRQDERCLECYETYRKEYKANKEKERRDKIKVKNVDSSF